MKAIVLIKTYAGECQDCQKCHNCRKCQDCWNWRKAYEACRGLTHIDGVKRADVVTGPYDIIAMLASKQSSLGSVVASIQDVPGVYKTETHIDIS